MAEWNAQRSKLIKEHHEKVGAGLLMGGVTLFASQLVVCRQLTAMQRDVELATKRVNDLEQAVEREANEKKALAGEQCSRPRMCAFGM